MAVTLSEAVKALVDGRNFATISTVNADGSPHSAVMWITRDGEDLLFSTLQGRKKERNLRRDPRVSVSVWDQDGPESYAELRGTVTITEDEGGAVKDALAHKYTGKPFPEEAPGSVRVVLRVSVDRVTGHTT
ncbi:PPOX class F420-dependent oxidoreductase [Actinosynnema sp. NPDC020468]|uniref:PPOX class F420-dependent oxidoreductase n=1 Tax=Actinosynnema sp. NPDC020468 TaxID=3154488 RepID=UPI003401992B